MILSNHAGYSLGEIVTQNPQLFMEVTVMANPALGVPADLTLLPRQQLASVPYALSQTESSPGIVEGALLRKASAQSPGPGWQTITGLDGLALEVPSAGCLLEVRAEVVLAGSDRVVGVQLEESAAGGAYAVVRGPVATRTQSDSKPDALALSHLLVEPATGTYTYRVRSRENSGSSYTVSPSLTNVGQTESTLSGKVICP